MPMAITHIASFNRDRSLLPDVKIDGTPRGLLGTEADYNCDGWTDIMFANGGSSTIGIGYDWSGSSAALTQVKIPMLGDAIQNGTGVDFDGDGHLDFFGSKDSNFHAYFNTSGIATQMTALRLAEGQRVPDGAINGVAQSLVTGDGNNAFAVTLLASISGNRNAVGYYEIGQDGTFGTVRFLNMNLPEQEGEAIGLLRAGSRLGLFLVVDEERLNPDLSGDLHFMREGIAARLSGAPPPCCCAMTAVPPSRAPSITAPMPTLLTIATFSTKAAAFRRSQEVVLTASPSHSRTPF